MTTYLNRRLSLLLLAGLLSATAAPAVANDGNSGNGSGNSGNSNSDSDDDNSGNGNSGNDNNGDNNYDDDDDDDDNNNGGGGDHGGGGNGNINGSSNPNTSNSGTGKYRPNLATGNSRRKSEQDRALQAVKRGSAVSLQRVLTHCRANYEGKVLDVKLRVRNKKLVYEVRLLTKTNFVRFISLDARSLNKF